MSVRHSDWSATSNSNSACLLAEKEGWKESSQISFDLGSIDPEAYISLSRDNYTCVGYCVGLTVSWTHRK